ncbi:transporter substrate-binding domain-containing protein [Alteromonas mediterranea]|uniref:transporter substrate-binding domain-containing protein n=1 Tax=Alteromonas mediterranea TaxID=314275 RepID=UPI001E44CA3F|nr:transporter substrate-binding domain-containing protein [Alteromonas mediterranea]
MKKFGSRVNGLRHVRSFLFALALFTPAIQAETFIVGAQNIAYDPYYNFSSKHEKGLGWAILEAFSKQSGHQFVYLSMPVKRLQIELKKGNVDFVFPDNPRWSNSLTYNLNKIYSTPLVETFSVTLIKPENTNKGVSSIGKLVIPDGFSPVKWKKQISEGTVNTFTVASVYEGLSLLHNGEVDAMDIEYNVARHITRQHPQVGPFSADLTLPYNAVSFSLSTLKYPNIIEELNAFLHSKSETINKIKEKYGIEETKHLIKQLMKEQELRDNMLWSPL